MGKGQRHSKNAGVMGSEGLSYHERKGLGYGTVQERLGKDSLGNFYDCCLTLQPAVDPVVTPEGYLFSKEAILENLVKQKKQIKRKLEAWEQYKLEEQRKDEERRAIAETAKLVAFDRQNHMGISESTANSIRTAIEAEAATLGEATGAKSVIAIKDNADRLKELKAFWMPSLTPEAKDEVQKPDTDTVCPASGKKLRMKDLVPVKFTKVPDSDDNNNSEGRFMDPLTKETFTNGSKLVVLKPTGHVVLKDTYLKCIKSEGQYDGVKIKEKDVIELKTGGTGFIAHDGERLQSQKHWTLGPGSGRQDLRGQHKGARSLGGLVIMN